MRKQTKLWTTKDGRKIRICDMNDRHLARTIMWLRNAAVRTESDALNSGWAMLSMLQGDMANMHMENELDSLVEDGIAPEEISELYGNLADEAERRGITIDLREARDFLRRHRLEKRGRLAFPRPPIPSR